MADAPRRIQNGQNMTELSSILRRFYAEFKTNQKKDLTASALTSIRAAIERSSSIPGGEVKCKFVFVKRNPLTSSNLIMPDCQFSNCIINVSASK